MTEIYPVSKSIVATTTYNEKLQTRLITARRRENLYDDGLKEKIIYNPKQRRVNDREKQHRRLETRGDKNE